MSKKILSIENNFVVLDRDKKATIEKFDSTLYQRLVENYDGFKDCELIPCQEFERDWSSWEIHPKGDEIVILLSGVVTFILQLETEKKTIFLDEQCSYLIVPRNVWHTAKTNVKTKLLFITPGEGTQNKDI